MAHLRSSDSYLQYTEHVIYTEKKCLFAVCKEVLSPWLQYPQYSIIMLLWVFSLKFLPFYMFYLLTCISSIPAIFIGHIGINGLRISWQLFSISLSTECITALLSSKVIKRYICFVYHKCSKDFLDVSCVWLFDLIHYSYREMQKFSYKFLLLMEIIKRHTFSQIKN